MSSAFLIAAFAAAGITSEWQPVSNKQADNAPGKEHSVLVQAEEDADAPTGPQRHGVLKPPAEEDEIRAEDFAPIRHSVYQQTYPPQNYSTQAAIEDGFRQYNTAATEQRKSIGSELAKGTQKVIDETGRAFRNTGEMVEGTAKNIGDGLRSIVSPGVTPTAGVTTTPQNGYQPYSYSQPTPLPGYNATPTQTSTQNPGYNPASSPLQTPALSQPTAASGQQPYASVGGATPTGQQQGAWNGSTTPTPNNYSQAPQQTPPSSQQPPNPNQYSAPNPSQYAGGSNPQPSSGGNQAFVDFGGTTNNDSYAPIPGTQTAGNTPGGQQPANQQNYQQNYTPQSNQQPPALNNDDWPDWPTNAQTVSTQQQQPPQQQQYNPYPYGPTTTPTSYGAGGQAQAPAGQNPANWGAGGSIDSPYTPPPSQNPPADQTVTTPPEDDRTTKTWFALVTVAAIGSIAWNFYLGMNYVDARNKYRAALRRSGRAYSEVLDDM